jgi:hypothetical protein
LWAYGPKPADGSTIDERQVALEWKPGLYVQSTNEHILYFSSRFADVNNRSVGVRHVLNDPCYPIPGTLALGGTYYWRVDEVNSVHPDSPWKGRVWSFSITECLMLDDMEDYNDRDDIREIWTDGYATVDWGDPPTVPPVTGGSSGSNLSVSTVFGAPIYNGDQSMIFSYDNDTNVYVPGFNPYWHYDAPAYSEIEASTTGPNSLNVGVNWAARYQGDSAGVPGLSDIRRQPQRLSRHLHRERSRPRYRRVVRRVLLRL